MSQNCLNWNTEIRKLQLVQKYTLGKILSVSDSWKKLMAIIPKNGSDIPRFNSEHISIMEQAEHLEGRSAAELFLDEWSTMGRQRPTLQMLQRLLIKAELFRAADYVARDLLNEEPPERPRGPAAPVDTSDEALIQLLQEQAIISESDVNALSVGTEAEMSIGRIMGLPDVPVDAAKNMEETKKTMEDKLIIFNDELSNVENINRNNSKNYEENVKEHISDLIKFSTKSLKNESFVKGNSCSLQYQMQERSTLPIMVHENREYVSDELPIYIKHFQESPINQNGEVLSEELPVYLNQNDSSLHESNSSTDSSVLCHISKNNTDDTYFFNNQVKTSELPQCIMEIRSSNEYSDVVGNGNSNSNIANAENVKLNMLHSEDTPIVVLECIKNA